MFFETIEGSGGNSAADTRKDPPVTDATLTYFRDLADAMRGSAPADWQWIGPHMSQRMFGLTRERAEAYAARHGGEARPMADRA